MSLNVLRTEQPSLLSMIFNNTMQDEAASLVDKLSAIGGTMGLLTGFSLISGVEILYFLGRIVLGIIEGK